MKNVSFPESRFSFSEVVRGIAILAIAVSWAYSRAANAGAWEYQAPYSFSNGTNGISAPTGSGAGMQLFRENITYTITPYVPPAQQSQSNNNGMMFAMMGLAMAPMLFSDSPANHAPAQQKVASAANGYQLVRDTPSSQTVRRGPAAVPLRTRYQQTQPQQNPSGAR